MTEASAPSRTASPADRAGFHIHALLRLLAEAEAVHPLGDRVLVLPLDSTELIQPAKHGLVVVHDQDKDMKPWKATVVAVGEGFRQDGTLVPLDLVPGDLVLVGRFVGSPIEHGGIPHRLVPIADILAKLVVG